MSSENLLPRESFSSSSGGGGGGFSFVVALCFCVNYVLGTGFLALPWAFNSAGILLSCVVLTLMGLLSDVTKNLLLEALSLTELMERARRGGRSIAAPDLSYATMDATTEEEEEEEGGEESAPEDLRIREPLVLNDSHQRSVSTAEAQAKVGELELGSSRYEITELCDILLGHRGRDIYTGIICVYMYGALWAYAAVFANALAAHVPLAFLGGSEHASYLGYLALFAVLTVPLTCMEMKDQVSVQVVLALMRCVLVLAIVGSTLAALKDGDAFDGVDGPEGTPLWDISQVYRLAPVALYSNIFHHSIPGLSATVKDKSSLSRLFLSVFVIINMAYALIGIVVAYYFGDKVKSSANLNWIDYAAGPAAWRNALGFFVVVFPALDVLSAFPLNGITLGNNMSAAYYGQSAQYTLRTDRFARTAWRLAAAVPPILGAAAVKDLGIITEFAGSTGFLIAFFFPALLYLAARRRYDLETLVGKPSGKGSLVPEAADIEASDAATTLMANFDDRGIFASLAFGARCAAVEKVSLYSNFLSSPGMAFFLACGGFLGMLAVFTSVALQEAGAI